MVVTIDRKVIGDLAGLLDSRRVENIFDFCEPGSGVFYPPASHPRALDFFFTLTLHQYGFWLDDGAGYLRPYIGEVGGKELKGSDFLWRCGVRALEEQPEFFTPAFQAGLTREGFEEVFRDDSGHCGLPMAESHLRLARGYGRDLEELDLAPESILERSLRSDRPLETLLDYLRKLSGYREDPWGKKRNFLALILAARPERFLPLRLELKNYPIVDYHIQRGALRTGMVEVGDRGLLEKLENRRILSSEEEGAVREAVFKAFLDLLGRTEKGLGEVDQFFFQFRKNCPEMEEPRCDGCLIRGVCARRTELFQPVFRTTYY